MLKPFNAVRIPPGAPIGAASARPALKLPSATTDAVAIANP